MHGLPIETAGERRGRDDPTKAAEHPPVSSSGLPAGAIATGDVAAALGISLGTLYNKVAQGQVLPDGRTAGRVWWWPATVQAYMREHRPAATLTARQVAQLLQIPLRAVYRQDDLRPVGRFNNRPRWAITDVLAFRDRLPPADAVRVPQVARLLGVSQGRVRALAASTWPADGKDPSGRWWWHPHRVDELLGPRRRADLANEAADAPSPPHRGATGPP
jgi:predicted DNA-binding transcriptional regulator AlpA